MLSALTNERRLLKVQNTIDLVLLRKTTIKRKTVSRSNSNNSNSNSEITNTKKIIKKVVPAARPSVAKDVQLKWDSETGTIFYVAENDDHLKTTTTTTTTSSSSSMMFTNKQNRPVLRTGAEAQTLPLPDLSLVSDKKLKKVQMTSSVECERDCPEENGLPEIALIGRSNVGKSSLLNMLTHGTSNAIVSANPGTTRSINHYLVDAKWYIVDLPGYGFAKASEEEILRWDTFARNYFKTRNTLCGVLLLIDASIETQEKDVDYANYLIGNDIPFTIVFTKCDRKKDPNAPSVEDNIEALQNRLDETWHRLPSIIRTSSVSKEGREDILKFISSIILFKRRSNAEKKENKRRLKARTLKENKYKEKASKTKMRKRPPPSLNEAINDDSFVEEEEEEMMFRKEVASLSERTRSILAKELQEMSEERRG